MEMRPGLSGKKNEVALQRAEMKMVRWICNVKVKDRVPSKELRERLGIDDIILILQQSRLQWYGHVLRKEDTNWVKKCMDYEVEGSRPIDRPTRRRFLATFLGPAFAASRAQHLSDLHSKFALGPRKKKKDR